MKLFMAIAVAAFFGPLIVIAKEGSKVTNPITYWTLLDQRMGPIKELVFTASTATEKTKEFIEKTLKENSDNFNMQIDLSASYGVVSGSTSTSFGFASSQSSETSSAKSLAQQISATMEGTYEVPKGFFYMEIAQMQLYVLKQNGQKKSLRIPTGKSYSMVLDLGQISNLLKDDTFNFVYEINGKKPIKMFTIQQMVNAVPNHLIKPAKGVKPKQKTRSWTGWSNSNTAGKLNLVRECAEGSYVTDLTWRDQWGYGFVNLKMKCSKGRSYEMNDNTGGDFITAMTCSEGFRDITGMEQSGYGIVNVKGHCLDRQEQITAGRNMDGDWKTELKCPKDQNIVGVQVREQSGYGIINFRIRCA